MLRGSPRTTSRTRVVTLAALGLLALTSLACELTTFVIPEGAHYSTQRIAFFRGSEMRFNAIFDESAIYRTADPTNQADINKLYGFSDCTSHHHQNSARFGWRWYNDSLQIHAYIYEDGTRRSVLMGTVGLHETHEYAIRFDGPHYIFSLDGHEVTMPRGCDGNGGIKYRLWPYFGGDETAPHEIKIIVQDL